MCQFISFILSSFLKSVDLLLVCKYLKELFQFFKIISEKAYMKLVYVKLPKYVRKRREMRIREKCYISLGDGKVTVLNEAGEETCLNDFTDKEAQAKDMLLEIKRLLCDFYYVPKFFVVNDFYVYWDSDFDKALRKPEFSV